MHTFNTKLDRIPTEVITKIKQTLESLMTDFLDAAVDRVFDNDPGM